MKLLLISISLFVGQSLYSCTCAFDRNSIELSYKHANYAFKGIVIETEKNWENDTTEVEKNGRTEFIISHGENPTMIIHFEVLEVYKGTIELKKVLVEVPAFSSCGQLFEENETYFMFSSKVEDGKFQTAYCNGSKIFSQKDEMKLKSL